MQEKAGGGGRGKGTLLEQCRATCQTASELIFLLLAPEKTLIPQARSICHCQLKDAKAPNLAMGIFVHNSPPPHPPNNIALLCLGI